MAIQTHNWAVGEVVTAANMNTYVRDNIADLDTRMVIIDTGTYSGDTGTTHTITGVGFTPKFLQIWDYQTAATSTGNERDTWMATNSMVDNNAAGLCYKINEDGNVSFQIDMIRAVNADGFVVGDAAGAPNVDGNTYEYYAIG